VTPANWGLGQDVMVKNDVSDEEAEDMFPKGFTTIRRWFRLVNAPENTINKSNME